MRASTTTKAPATLVTQRFAEELEDMIKHYDEDASDFEQVYSSVYEGQLERKTDPTRLDDPLLQNNLQATYAELLESAGNSILFLCYCQRNAAFLPPILERFKESFWKKHSLWAGLFGQNTHIEREIEYYKSNLFGALDLIEPLLDETTNANRKQVLHHCDPFCYEQLGNTRFDRWHFNDWVEYNFLSSFDLPLGRLPTSKKTAQYIHAKLASNGYRANLLADIVRGDLHLAFPGLSLNGKPKNIQDFKQAGRALPTHITEPFSHETRVVSFAENQPEQRSKRHKPRLV